jgi:ATP-binding cassette subfamily B protein
MFFGFLFRNLKGYRFLLVIAVAMAVAQVFSNILVSLPAKFIGDVLQGNKDPQATIIPKSIQDAFLNLFDGLGTTKGLHAGQIHTVLGVIVASVVLLIAFSVLAAILAYIQLYLAAFLAQNLSARLRKNLFGHLQRLSLDWHGKQKKGDLVQRVTGNIADIEKFMTDALVDSLVGGLTIVFVITVMLLTSVGFTIVSAAIIPALALTVFVYQRSIKAAAKRASKSVGQVADVAVEDVGAITVLKAFSLEQREADRFGRYVEQTREAGLKAGGLAAQFNPVVTVLVALGTAAILGVGSYAAAGHTINWLGGIIYIPGADPKVPNSLTLGTVFQFITLLGLLFQPFKDLSKTTVVFNNASAGAERIQEILDQAPEVLESSVPYTGPSRLRGDIAFENVLFGYTPEKLILKGINLHIAAGKKVALVGLSGGGKTTLVKLIPRFYEVTQGSVKIDGIDNRMYPLTLLRQNVGMVLQESVMFEGTVLDNLKIGRPDATMEEVIDAAKQAQIHEAIMDFPDGYNTLVRNQGKNFSGGQRQRMAIARAILSRAPILILDEPTASLDVEAEAEVMNALDKLVVGRTVLMISHRLSTLGQVDEIIVLKDGRIVERGSYKQLRQANGVFAGLLKEQNRYNVEDIVGKSIVASRFVDLEGDYGLRQVPPSVPRIPVPPPQPVPAGRQHGPVGSGNGPIQVGGGYPENGGQQRQAQVNNTPQRGLKSDNARVQVEIDGKVVREQPLNKPVLTVGRLSSNDIPILADRVSRLHARIRWENGNWLIEDADSLNGISYQGTRIDRHVLMNGDTIALAPKAVLHYRAG